MTTGRWLARTHSPHRLLLTGFPPLPMAVPSLLMSMACILMTGQHLRSKGANRGAISTETTAKFYNDELRASTVIHSARTSVDIQAPEHLSDCPLTQHPAAIANQCRVNIFKFTRGAVFGSEGCR